VDGGRPYDVAVRSTLERQPAERSAGPRLAISLPQLWAVVAVVLPVIALHGALGTIDLAYHVRAGDSILHTHMLPARDTYTFTVPGAAWLDQQWGAQVVFAMVYRALGWPGLSLLQILLGALTVLFVYLACRNAGTPPRVAAALTLAAFAIAWTSLTLRPQLLAAVLFAISLWLIAGRRAHPERLWWMPLVVAVWANVHGSFVLGPVLLGLAALQDRYERSPATRRVLWVTGVSLVATLLNPFGPRVWSYAYGIARNPLISKLVIEWQPPSIRHIDDALFFISVAAVVYLLARRGRPTPWPALAWLGVFFVLALTATRNTMWWGLAAAPILAGLLAGQERTPRPELPASPVNSAIAVCLVLLVGIFFTFSIEGGSMRSPGTRVADAPVALTARLHQVAEPGDRIFNFQRWGSWFELSLPDDPVFVDSRIELFPAAVWNDYLAVSNAKAGWNRILDRWRIAVVAVNPDQQDALVRLMKQDPAWRLDYQDDEGVIFVRS
jgi:hypothetical protein